MSTEIIKSAVVALLVEKNWFSRPAFPHIFYHERFPKTRWVFRDHVLRKEGQYEDGGWFRIRSGYYKHLTITDGKIGGLK